MSEQNLSAGARIVDRGYQHYSGTRQGLTHSFWVMFLAALKRGLGLRRSFRNKIMPWLLIIVACFPVIILLGAQIILGRSLLDNYDRIYSRIIIAYVLFAGLVAPDLICADRRQKVISLYFASPITRLHYVASQVASLVTLLLLLSLVPFVLLFFGQALLAPSFGSYVSDHRSELWHILLSGVLLALYYGALAMAVASFTDRRPYASGGFFGLLFVSSIAGNVLSSSDIHIANNQWFSLLNLITLPSRVVQWMFDFQTQFLPVDGAVYLWVTLGVIVASLGLMAWRYLKIGGE